jgi:aryl-alcohol dehydrogenase-like predicted oxidoreductase
MAERLRAVGQRYGRSAGQVAIRWALENPNVRCAIVGAKTADQVRENVGAIGWRLDPEERQQLTVPSDCTPRAASTAKPVSTRA